MTSQLVPCTAVVLPCAALPQWSRQEPSTILVMVHPGPPWGHTAVEQSPWRGPCREGSAEKGSACSQSRQRRGRGWVGRKAAAGEPGLPLGQGWAPGWIHSSFPCWCARDGYARDRCRAREAILQDTAVVQGRLCKGHRAREDNCVREDIMQGSPACSRELSCKGGCHTSKVVKQGASFCKGQMSCKAAQCAVESCCAREVVVQGRPSCTGTQSMSHTHPSFLALSTRPTQPAQPLPVPCRAGGDWCVVTPLSCSGGGRGAAFSFPPALWAQGEATRVVVARVSLAHSVTLSPGERGARGCALPAGRRWVQTRVALGADGMKPGLGAPLPRAAVGLALPDPHPSPNVPPLSSPVPPPVRRVPSFPAPCAAAARLPRPSPAASGGSERGRASRKRRGDTAAAPGGDGPIRAPGSARPPAGDAPW